ncbi:MULTISPECIES: tripartite tricarboxylate transporter substrate binding protein [Cupriavidus]|uniref:Tripartite tricarboxylate transporter substrate binding protein n=1 Tax=Cupriavidus pauculus TaxID=82633 RepID=A0A3G8H554_9BURK|nr:MULTISPECIES: tripartite tricarboxylate transporter substrate binding protein [Cupriavidus]AZG15536.1 tripartite tricarboxylate transporter substrate binding protein [Cupriavidus pauculus]MDT6961949.1 tripartite tricarboxylate transporter substrate binding protein [Cupriavidus sp. SZY C1]
MTAPHTLTAIALGLAVIALPARAEFPDKTVRIVVPYSAGGGTDIVARRLAERLTPRLKQSVVVDNRPGANGIIGTEYVVKSPPDGHTYVLVVNTHLLNPILYKKLPYDTFADLVGVTMVCQSPLVFVTQSEFPARNAVEFARHVKAKPDKYSYGSSENMTRLVGEMYNKYQHLDMVNVAYKGGAPLMTDVIGGVTTVGVTSVLTAKPFITAGKLRPLAVTGAQRTPALPNVPTMIESGMKDFEVYTSYSLYAPARTPKAALERMQKEIHEIVMAPDMKEILAEQAATPVAQPVDAFNEQVKKDFAFWQRLAKEVNLQAE